MGFIKGMIPAALHKLDRLDALFPNDPGSILTRATLLGRMKRHDEAVVLLDRTADASSGLGPTELSEKGPPARSASPLRRRMDRLHRSKAHLARATSCRAC